MFHPTLESICIQNITLIKDLPVMVTALATVPRLRRAKFSYSLPWFHLDDANDNLAKAFGKLCQSLSLLELDIISLNLKIMEVHTVVKAANYLRDQEEVEEEGKNQHQDGGNEVIVWNEWNEEGGEADDDDISMDVVSNYLSVNAVISNVILDMTKDNEVLQQLRLPSHMDTFLHPTSKFHLELNRAGRCHLLHNPSWHDKWMHATIRFRRNPSVSFFFLSRNPDLIVDCQAAPSYTGA